MKKINIFAGAFSAVVATLIMFGPVSAQMAPPGGPSGWTRTGQVVHLTTSTDKVGIGTTNPLEKLDIAGNIAVSGTVDGFDISVKGINWDTAFLERRQWDGGATNLDATAGRASLLLNSLKVNDSNSLNGAVFKDTDGAGCHKLSINSSGTVVATAVNCATGQTPIADTFDSYATDSPLSGQNGGVGWDSPWQELTANTTGFPVQDSGCFSGKCVRATDATGGSRNRRSFAPINDGSGSVYAKVLGDSSQYIDFCATTDLVDCTPNGPSIKFYLEFSASFGSVSLNTFNGSGGTSQPLGSLSPGTWGKVDFEYGSAGGTCGSNEVRARLNGGTWSNCIAMARPEGLQNVILHFNPAPGREIWFDEFVVAN